jgi:hypothetical protein
MRACSSAESLLIGHSLQPGFEEREERSDLIVLRAPGRRTPSRTNKANQAGGTATEWNARRQSRGTHALAERRSGGRAWPTNVPAVSWAHAS